MRHSIPKQYALIAMAFIILASLVFLPGLSGPFVFDDFSNITRNKFLQFDTLSLGHLFQAAMSSDSGPLKRPLTMLTFGLNAWFAGGTGAPESFKIWNLVIHAVNGVLVFVLTCQVLKTHQHNLVAKAAALDSLTSRYPLVVAALVAALWIANPIQLTSVLYVVQRMTSLSALFVLLALISYVSGRRYQETVRRKFILYRFVLPSIFIVLGIASKENAVLFPLFVIVLELTLFADKPVWMAWRRWRINRVLFSPWFGISVAVLGTAVLVYYSLPGYHGREFTLMERLLTESRVVSSYILLIFAPRLSGFGIHHDDLPISHGLLSPPTTLLSIVFLFLLIVFAWKTRRRLPLVSFGILFFFSGHLLESTVLPLEIMHEHRNYLPSFGLMLALVAGIASISDYLKTRLVLAAIPVFFILFSYTSFVRASDWSNVVTLYSNEVVHHPNSVRSLVEFSGILKLLHRDSEAMAAIQRAIKLKPGNPILMIELRKYEKIKNDETVKQDAAISKLLQTYPLNPFLKLQFESVLECLPNYCRHLLHPYEHWLVTIVNRDKELNDPSYFMYLLGRTYILKGKGDDAIQAMRVAVSLDPSYMQPRFMLFYLYLDAKRLDDAGKVLDEIKKESALGSLKWTNEISVAQSAYDSGLKSGTSLNK